MQIRSFAILKSPLQPCTYVYEWGEEFIGIVKQTERIGQLEGFRLRTNNCFWNMSFLLFFDLT